jgi:hypothetical protein
VVWIEVREVAARAGGGRRVVPPLGVDMGVR